MLMVLLKTLIIYAYLLLIMRLMGKREVGQLQTFELVVSMIIEMMLEGSIEVVDNNTKKKWEMVNKINVKLNNLIKSVH